MMARKQAGLESMHIDNGKGFNIPSFHYSSVPVLIKDIG
jgi:hypothetical protein